MTLWLVSDTRAQSALQSRRARMWSILPAIALHAAVLWIFAYCPSAGSLQLMRSSETFARARPANERLVYVKPVSKPASANTRKTVAIVKTKSATVPTTVAAESEIGDAIDRAIRDTIGDGLDSAATATATSTDTLRTGANDRHMNADTATAGVYVRPIHPALRGLVPGYGDGRLWGPVGAGVSASASLRPKPPDCAAGPGYFGCVNAQRQWRDDSIYHVVFRCRKTSKTISFSQPADCTRFITDTSKR